MNVPHVNPREYDAVAQKLRDFFRSKGFVEAYTQNRLSILAACEDPETIAVFDYAHEKWPLIQTNQMWLEDILLKDPTLPGLFCFSTSYRDEPNPVPGRHDKIFPLFEFECKGTADDMIQLEKELLTYLGFKGSYSQSKYEPLAETFESKTIDHEEETYIGKNMNNVFFLTDFPESTSPFWNMRRNKDGTSRKIDVLLHGMETIGSAERSCDVEDMRERFHTISDGEYAGLIFSKFGKDRVEAELEAFFSHSFFPRFGGGIGMTRLIRGMRLSGLLSTSKAKCYDCECGPVCPGKIKQLEQNTSTEVEI